MFLHYLFLLSLAHALHGLCRRIEGVEVVCYYRYRKRNHQDAGDRACAPYDLSQGRLGVEVAIANGGHCDNSPPETFRDRHEVVVFHLHKEHEVGIDDHSHGEEDNQQDELFVTGLNRHQENLQGLVVLDELEQPEESQHSQEHHKVVGEHHSALLLPGEVHVGKLQSDHHPDRDDAQQVCDIKQPLTEMALVWGCR